MERFYKKDGQLKLADVRICDDCGDLYAVNAVNVMSGFPSGIKLLDAEVDEDHYHDDWFDQDEEEAGDAGIEPAAT